MLEPPEELTQNGRSEPLQHDEQQVIPVAGAAPPLAQVNPSQYLRLSLTCDLSLELEH